VVPVASLWLPILLSAVLVFFASFAIHMLLGYHRADYGKLPSEDLVQDALRGFAIPPGDYMLPRPGRGGARDPEFVAKHKKGPVAMMTIFPAGDMSMGPQLAMWFVYCAGVGLLTAYLATLSIGSGAPYQPVFHFVSIVAFMGYGLALVQQSIWYRRKWGTTIRTLIDSLIYGMLTGGAFGWLWPR
jgi:hypothetical protein